MLRAIRNYLKRDVSEESSLGHPMVKKTIAIREAIGGDKGVNAALLAYELEKPTTLNALMSKTRGLTKFEVARALQAVDGMVSHRFLDQSRDGNRQLVWSDHVGYRDAIYARMVQGNPWRSGFGPGLGLQ